MAAVHRGAVLVLGVVLVGLVGQAVAVPIVRAGASEHRTEDTADAPPVQYVLMNHAPGAVWNQGDPSTVDCDALFTDVVKAVGAPRDRALQVGVSLLVSLFQTPLPTLQQSVAAALNCSASTNVPVFFGLDGQNWWSGSNPWNWWDPSQPGYSPDNVHNVERTSWPPASGASTSHHRSGGSLGATSAASTALRISWRDWGSQIRVLPAQNIHSPTVLSALRPRMTAVATQIAQWARALPAAQQHLFAGVKVGWESGIGFNAWYYPDGNKYEAQWPHNASHDPTYGLNCSKGIACGVTQIGYAAVASARWQPQHGRGGPLTRYDIGNVTNMYIGNLTAWARSAGLPADKLHTHVGGTNRPYNNTIPVAAAVVPGAVPGMSVYYGTPPGAYPQLGPTLKAANRTTWAAVEWYLSATSEAEWVQHFNGTLGFMQCQLVAVYNWAPFAASTGGLDAVRALVLASPPAGNA